MAAIVYEGMLGNGDLFAGKKFFILQKVPMRNTFVQNVESNGGEVVRLEMQADMVIADHVLRKFAPANWDCYSWTYIEQSVKNGMLEDPEKHLIHHAKSSNASPASQTPGFTAGRSRPKKSTRTPFTRADDDFLRRWVAKKSSGGRGGAGVQIYTELERINNRHTWQSWKDRYMTFYRGKPPPDGLNDDDLEPAIEMPESQPPARARGYRHIVKPSEIGKIADEVDEQGILTQHDDGPVPRALRVAAPRIIENQEFTKADHDMLVEDYEHIAEVERKGTNVLDAWFTYEKGNGRHTAQEWRNYFLNVVKPSMAKKLHITTESVRKKSVVKAIAEEDEEASGEEEEHPARVEVEPSQDDFLQNSAPFLSNQSPKTSSVPTTRRTSTKPQGRNASSSVEIEPQHKSVSEDKAAFLEDLRTVARATHKQIEPVQEVLGRQVQLYKLWSTVNDQSQFKSFEYVEAHNLWPKLVPVVFGTSTIDRSSAGKALRDLYTTFLVKVEREKGAGSSSGSKLAASNTSATAPGQTRSTANATEKNRAVAPSPAPSKKRAVESRAPSYPQRPANAMDKSHDDVAMNRSHERRAGSPRRDGVDDARAEPKSLPVMAANGAVTSTQTPRKVPKAPLVAEALPKHGHLAGPGLQDTLQTFMDGASKEAEQDEELTVPEKKMLGKLVLFAKEVFNIDIEATGVTICNRWVSLPKFQQVVNEYGGFDAVTKAKLWTRVAKDLGYKPVSRYEGVQEELREVYSEILDDFDKWSQKVQEERERRASLSAQDLRRLTDEDSGVVVPRTSPQKHGSSIPQKHSRKVSDMAAHNVQDTFKRRRVDRKGKGKEIPDEVPATPEHIYNSSYLSQNASVVKDSQDAGLVSDAESHETEAFQPINRSLFKNGAATLTPEIVDEPETQEFPFISPGSPSQQLYSEAMAAESPTGETRKGDTSLGRDDEVAVADPTMEDYFAQCAREGYTPDVASRALAYANWDVILAQKILNRVARSQPIPDNVPGLWPAKDDEILLQGLPNDHPKMVKLIRKHGLAEVEDRKDFLETMGEEAESEE